MKMKKIISVLIHDRRGGFNVRKGLIIILLVASFATGVISYSSKPSALGRVKLSKVKNNFFILLLLLDWRKAKKPIAFWYCERFLESRVIFDA